MLTDRESGPRQESENFDRQVKEAQCEVGVRRRRRQMCKASHRQQPEQCRVGAKASQHTEFKDEIKS